jgi:lysophospholipase L1-like esterase
MQETNALVAEFIRGKRRLAYVDTATPMLGPLGQPRPELFLEDGLHMNAAGYRIWSDRLRAKLAAH